MTSVPARVEFTRPDMGRKRLYSWSRPSRDTKTKGIRSLPRHSEHCISGQATIAFHPSGDWFQGNVISPSYDAYTVFGRKRVERQGRLNRPIAAAAARLTACPEDSEESGGSGSSSASLTESRSSSDSPTAFGGFSPEDNGSVCDSLDSELIRVAMESLELELVAEGLYNLTIIDYETGLNHKIKGVNVMLEGDSLTLESDQLSFASTASYKGNKADIVITSNIGPGLAEIGMTVFRGEMQVSYTEEPCYPVTNLEDSQWCL